MTRFLVAAALVASIGTAGANGRPPATNGIFFKPGDSQTTYVRSTFGLLISQDQGCTFRWVCEQAIGYGGTFDPKYVIAPDGTIYATTFDGLRVSRDGGCSFTTATAELPAGMPGRIADIWVDALDIATNGEVWVGTAETGQSNDVYRSTDGGVTFVSSGLPSPTMSYKSIAVAPSDPMRVYVTGFEHIAGVTTAHMFTTSDGGQTWTPTSLASITMGSPPSVLLSGVDPTNPSIVYVRSVAGTAPRGDHLYRSTDAGQTFTEVLVTTEYIQDVVIFSAATVLVTSAPGAAFRSDDGGLTFIAIADAPQLACLAKRPDGTLVGCGTNWQPDFMAVAHSNDGATWSKVFRFVEMAGPIACAAGTAGHDVCEQELWPNLQTQFATTGPTCGAGADVVTEPPPGGGCCDSGDGSPVGGGALLLFALALLVRRR